MEHELPQDVKDKIVGKETDRIIAKVRYKNWKGEIGIRQIIPLEIFYGNSEYHTEEQWLMRVWDIDRKDYRVYAARDIIEWY